MITYPPSPQGEGSEGESYIKDTKLDEYFDDIEERAQVIQDKRIEDANSALMTSPRTEKKTLREKVSESVSFVKRKMVNSADAIRKIAKTVKDEHLYGAFNRARSSMNIVSDMLRNKQTDVFGRKVGERRIFSCRGRRPRRPAILHFALRKEHLSMFLSLILLQP